MATVVLCWVTISLCFLSTGNLEQSLFQVRQIYVDSIGHNDEAVRFRGLLEEELVRQGFTVVKRTVDADAILGGVLSVRVVGGNSKAYATMTLKNKTGGILWNRRFKEGIFSLTSNDEVRNRAHDVAKRLHEDIRKAARLGK